MKLKYLLYSNSKFPYSIYYFIVYFPNFIKACWQRITKGIAYCDSWSLDDYLTDVIIEGCNQIRKRDIAYPNDLSSGEWKEKLTIIIEGFESARVILDDDTLDLDKNQRKWYYQRFKDGMKQFQKYYFSLWD